MEEVAVSAADVGRARRAYYASISYVDDLVGEIWRSWTGSAWPRTRWCC